MSFEVDFVSSRKLLVLVNFNMQWNQLAKTWNLLEMHHKVHHRLCDNAVENRDCLSKLWWCIWKCSTKWRCPLKNTALLSSVDSLKKKHCTSRLTHQMIMWKETCELDPFLQCKVSVQKKQLQVGGMVTESPFDSITMPPYSRSDMKKWSWHYITVISYLSAATFYSASWFFILKPILLQSENPSNISSSKYSAVM